MKQPLNMIEMINYAYELNVNTLYKDYIEKPKNLFSHFYRDFDTVFKKAFKEEGKEYKSQVYYSLQDIIIQYLCGDDGLYRNEYASYQKICLWAKVRPLSPDQMIENFNSFDRAKLPTLIKVYVKRRNLVEPNNYYNLVFMFCIFSFMSNGEMNEYKYSFLRNWFEEGFDVFPKTWADFKKQYKFPIA